MVVIRLARGGARNRPYYNIVVADSRNRRDGRFIERLGFYSPLAAEGSEKLRLALDRVDYWKNKGAQLSPTVNGLVKKAGATIAQAAPAVTAPAAAPAAAPVAA
jgi:small subunit ribosomal protein S16